MQAIVDKMKSLEEIGFKAAGYWANDGDGLRFQMVSDGKYEKVANVLYAFVVENQLKYIGKTTQQLGKRLAGYCNPAPTQSTNINNNQNICACLERSQKVFIYVLPDNGLLHYGGFHINLAAGLEDSLIRTLQPPWNGGKKEIFDGTLAPTEDD